MAVSQMWVLQINTYPNTLSGPHISQSSVVLYNNASYNISACSVKNDDSFFSCTLLC